MASLRASLAFGALVAGLGLPAVAPAADLIELFNRAQEVDPRVAQAERELAITRYQEDEARAGLMPRLTGQASKQWLEQEQTGGLASSPGSSIGGTSTYDQTTYGLTLTQPLFSGGRTWVAMDIADQAQQRAQAGLSAARQQLIVRVAEAYFGVLDAKEELGLAQRERKRVGEHLERAEAQYEVGTGDITGVREAEARRDQAQTRLIRARNGLRTARQRLRRQIRREVPALQGVESVHLQQPQPGEADAWVERALAESPQLDQLRQEQDIAAKNAELASRERWPELSASASYDQQEGGSIFDETTTQSYGINLSWPLYQGGAVSAKTAMERERAAQARLKLDDQRQAVRLETVQAYNDLETAIEEVRSLRAEASSAETQLEAVQTGFEVGRRTSLDVLDAQQVYFDALRNLASSRHGYLLARLELKAAAGVLSAEDVRRINAELD